ncbi:unnamed protein product, partial [Mesorhabditis spiculigera]
MLRKARSRIEVALLFASGFYHTADQWTRVLLPFFQWQLLPPGDFQVVVKVTSMGAISTGLGSFLVAQMIEALGVRKTAIIITLMTALYQFLITQVTSLYGFVAVQMLLVFNNLSVAIDAMVCQMEGEDGDDKKRKILISRLAIPQSIAYALGPYLALQTMFLITAHIGVCQTMNVVMHLCTVLPLICFAFPEHENPRGFKLALPSIGSYFELIKNERTALCMGLLLAVVGPYQAYDQVIRAMLTGAIVRNPTSMIYVFLVLGGTTLAVNLWLYPWLQTKFKPQQLLAGSFSVLTISYIHLSFSNDDHYYNLLLGLCIQVALVAVSVGELSSQILSTVSKKNAGKVAALLRSVHLLGAGLTPLVAGMLVDKNDYAKLCYCGALISLLAIPAVTRFGKFMRSQPAFLPMTGITLNTVPKLD